MSDQERTSITIETTVEAPVEKAWQYWTDPAYITRWCFATDDWHAPFAENDLRTGGKFVTRMEAKDHSYGFDFGGIYEEVKLFAKIIYSLGDGRSVRIDFVALGDQTKITETFDAEDVFSAEQQKNGWQAILDNYKKLADQEARKV